MAMAAPCGRDQSEPGKMSYRWLFCIALIWLDIGCVTVAMGFDPTAALVAVRTVPLPGVEGRIDHFAVDEKNQRLFVAALGNNTVEVVDLNRGQVANRIAGLAAPQGISFAADLNRLAVANARDGCCRVYDGASLQPVGTVALGDDADNVRYDAAQGLFWIGYGDGGLAAIDAKSLAIVADIKLDAHPESFQLESAGDRVFVNLASKHRVAVVDRRQQRVIADWPLVDAAANFPMALDEQHQLLFVGCREPAKLLALDAKTGKTVQSVDIVGDADDVFYDAARNRIYVAGGEGAVTMIEHADSRLTPIGRIATAPGARTALFVPASGWLFVAVPHRGDQTAELRIFEAAGQP